MQRHVATFVDQMAEFFEREGYAPITGRIFGRLLLSAEPMALDDLAHELGVSKASVSTETRRLAASGILVRAPARPSRRAFWQVSDDLPARIMEARLDRLRRFRVLLESTRPRIPASERRVRARIRGCLSAYGAIIGASDRALRSWRRGIGEGPAGR